MKSFKSFISESYENRVASAATAVTQKGKYKTKEALVSAIRASGATETRFSPNHPAYREFVKDVLRKVGRGHVERAPSPARQNREAALRNLWGHFESAAGNSFPDGDPHDMIMPHMEKHGFTHDDLQKAARKYGKVKSTDHYMKAMWNDYAGDNPDNHMNVKQDNNPW